MDKTSSSTARSLLKSYVVGFVLSLILTVNAFVLVMSRAFEGASLVFAIIALAMAQLIVQLLFFLHLGKGSRWNTIVFLFMLLTVIIVVAGSLWIMNNLNYNMMPHEMTEYMLNEAGVGH